MNVKLDEGAKLPTKAHLTDAGFDIYSREDKFIGKGKVIVFKYSLFPRLFLKVSSFTRYGVLGE